jgi:hypothetical protein
MPEPNITCTTSASSIVAGVTAAFRLIKFGSNVIGNTYSGEATDPKWTGMSWSREQLIEAVKCEYYDQFPADCEFTFIEDGMTPLEATLAADDHLPTRKHKAPDSLKKGKRRWYD